MASSFGREFTHPRMISHNGHLIAFALKERSLHYVALSAAVADKGDDAAAWPDQPELVPFPSELVSTGHGALRPARVPVAYESGNSSTPDPFLSSTACLTAAAPFKCISHGPYLYIFRSSLAASETDGLWRAGSGDLTRSLDKAVKSKGAPVSAVDRGVLVDRFLVIDAKGSDDQTRPTLQCVREVRYRRSRLRSMPQSATDQLGANDMDGKPFIEPTRLLEFLGSVSPGRFAVTLLPTTVPDRRRWLITSHRPKSDQLDFWQILQSEAGWFDTLGDLAYTSPDPKWQSAVRTRRPGRCPFTMAPLIPAERTTDRGDTAVRLSTADSVIELPRTEALGMTGGVWSFSFWFKPESIADGKVPLLRWRTAAGKTERLLYLDGGTVHFYTTRKTVKDTVPLTPGTWHHLAVSRVADKSITLIRDGRAVARHDDWPGIPGGVLVMGGQGASTALVGRIDEIRFWSSRTRSVEAIADDRFFRIRGDEAGLTAALRLDEGQGKTLADLVSPDRSACLLGAPEWTFDAAPIGAHPGLDRFGVRLVGTTLAGGVDARLYYQHEEQATQTGKTQTTAANARLMLAFGVADAAGDTTLATLDLGVGRDGTIARLPARLTLQAVHSTGSTDAQRDAAVKALRQAEVEVQKAANAVSTERQRLRNKVSSLEKVKADGEDADPAWWKNALTELQSRGARFGPTEAPFWDQRDERWKFYPAENRRKSVLNTHDNEFNRYWLDKGVEVDVWEHDDGSPGLKESVTEGSVGIKETFRKVAGKVTMLRVRRSASLVKEIKHYEASLATSRKYVSDGLAAARALPAARAARDAFDALGKSNPFKAAYDAAVVDRDRLRLKSLGIPSSVTLPTVHLDSRGLTASGATLDFARGPAEPVLTRSTEGRINLYFQGTDDALFGVGWTTATARARLSLSTDDSTAPLMLQARSADPVFDATVVTVTDGKDADHCTVEISNPSLAVRERWPDLPRALSRLVPLLNGGDPEWWVTVGQVKDPRSHETVASLNLMTLADHTAPTGSRIKVGDKIFVLDRPLNSKDEKIHVETISDVSVGLGDVIRLAQRYDRSTIESDTPGALFDLGSRLIRAIGGGGALENGTASSPSTARCEWATDAPGQAVRFTGRDALTGDAAQGAWRSPGSLTLETWLRPSPELKSNATIWSIAHGESAPGRGDARALLLRLLPWDDGFKVAAHVNGKHLQTQDNIRADAWSHVAVQYTHAWALKFDGKRALDAGDSSGLELTGDLTVEVALSVPKGDQGLLIKGKREAARTDRGVPYALWLDDELHPCFGFEGEGSTWVPLKADRPLTPNTAHRIAVTRKALVGAADDQDTTVPKAGETIKLNSAVRTEDLHTITFYIDGVEAGTYSYRGLRPRGRAGNLLIGEAFGAGMFNGTVSEVRLWNQARTVDQIAQHALDTDARPTAYWAFDEGRGEYAADRAGQAALSVRGTTWVDDPNPNAHSLALVINGAVVQTDATKAQNPDAGVSVGASQYDGVWYEYYRGDLEECRLWRTRRTLEQITDNRFGRLRGELQALRARFTFDEEAEDGSTRWLDTGPESLHLTAMGAPQRVMSEAPVASDHPAIRPALAGIKTDYHRIASSPASAAEYGDLQRMPDGSLLGVLKRAHTWIDADGEWKIRCGFKVGRLRQEWVGQAQYDPQVMGYVEGAPPVPSENMTKGAIISDLHALGASGLTWEESENVVYTAAHTKEHGLTTAFEAKGKLGAEIDTVIAPLGVGISIKGKLTIKGDLKMSGENTWTDGESVGSGVNRTTSLTVGIAGGWEAPKGRLNTALPPRFVPANQGFALVQSRTSDVYAVRLAHTGQLVQYRMSPNLDIPLDWNLIPFPINGRYTKQGSLDGKVGLDAGGNPVMDPDYANAANAREASYFKPLEAYALRRQIQEEEQRIQALYSQTDVKPAGAIGSALGLGAGSMLGGAAVAMMAAGPAGAAIGAALGIGVGLGGTIGGLVNALAKDEKLPQNMAGNNLANTYVWTADGGFLALSTQRSESRSETVGGDYEFAGSLGGGFKFETSAAVASGFELGGTVGGTLHINRTRTESTDKSFGLSVSVDPPGDLQAYTYDAKTDKAVRVYDKPSGDRQPQPITQVGKVDCYRFNSFYLEPTEANHDDLFNKVVDPIWLAQSNHPNARALRGAKSKSGNACWRILHRVTFVSRVLPEIPSADAPPLTKKKAQIGFRSNWELVRDVASHIGRDVREWAQLKIRVAAAIKTWLPALTGHEAEVTRLMAYYLEIPSE